MKKFLIATLALLVAMTGVALGILAARETRSLSGTASKLTGKIRTARTSSAGNTSAGDVKVVRFVSNPQPVPAFLVRDLDGNVISTADWNGKVILLNFWATWCPPCRVEIPVLIQLQKKYKGDGLLILGISLDDAPADEVKEFAKATGMNYPIIMRSRELLMEFGGVPALPTTFIINKEAKVVQKHEGLLPGALYEAEVRALLGLPVEAKIETFEDYGQVFLKNASRATELPGVDFKGLTADQKKEALKRLNMESCDCGCGLTLAQCRINDSSCATSMGLAAKVVKEVAGSAPTDSSPVNHPASNPSR
jgi:thiol-disulfide isomerase/thioredoxin